MNWREIPIWFKSETDKVRVMGIPGVGEELKAEAVYVYKIIRHTYRLFVDNRGPYQANALAYRMMISLIPMLAFMISLSTWLFGDMLSGLTDKLRMFMEGYLLPEKSGMIEPMFELIEKFKDQAAEGTGYGLLIFLVTSVLLINGLEMIFNNIWHVEKGRTYAWRILSYTAMMILIPVMLGFSIALSAQIRIETLLGETFQVDIVTQNMLFQWAIHLAKQVAAPAFMIMVLFLAMFKWLPATKVETFSAVIGSFAAAIAFEFAKWGFSFFVSRMVEARALWWGPIGIFLVFLVWVYLIWYIALFCAQLTYVIQNYRYVFRKGRELEGKIGEAYLAARVMLDIAKWHIDGEHIPSVRGLAESLEVEVPRIQIVLAKMIDANLLILGSSDNKRNGNEDIYLPGRDISKITIAQVVRAVTDVWQVPVPANDDSLDKVNEDGDNQPERKLESVLSAALKSADLGLTVNFRDIIEGKGEGVLIADSGD